MSLRQQLFHAIDDTDINSIDKIRVKDAIDAVLTGSQRDHCGYCGCNETVDAGDGLEVCASCGQWYYQQSPIPRSDALDLLDELGTTKYAVNAGDNQ